MADLEHDDRLRALAPLVVGHPVTPAWSTAGWLMSACRQPVLAAAAIVAAGLVPELHGQAFYAANRAHGIIG